MAMTSSLGYNTELVARAVQWVQYRAFTLNLLMSGHVAPNLDTVNRSEIDFLLTTFSKQVWTTSIRACRNLNHQGQ